MKKFLSVVALLALFGSFGISQETAQTAQDPGQSAATMKEFTRYAKMDGLVLNIVLLNNKTVDLLFSGESKYAMRAKANMATVFYVQGISEKDTTLDLKFDVEQGGKTFPGQAVNLKNLQAGKLAKGTRIAGVIQLGEKIDIAQPFKVKGAQNATAEFELTPAALKLLEN